MAKMKKEARMKMLKELRKMMQEDMHSPMKDMMEGMEGMKKITVASDSPEGLQEGLSKAQEIIKKKMMNDGELEDDYDMEDEFADGGYKRGYKKKDQGMELKKPKYMSHRREHKDMMHDKYKDGGMKKADMIKEMMKKRK